MDIYLAVAKFIGEMFKDLSVLFIVYFVLMNIITFALFYCDKQKAIKHKWRIPEATLLLFSFAGGSVGAFSAMRIFRHKTKHPKFYILVPVALVLHIAVITTGVIGMLH